MQALEIGKWNYVDTWKNELFTVGFCFGDLKANVVSQENIIFLVLSFFDDLMIIWSYKL